MRVARRGLASTGPGAGSSLRVRRKGAGSVRRAGVPPAAETERSVAGLYPKRVPGVLLQYSPSSRTERRAMIAREMKVRYSKKHSEMRTDPTVTGQKIGLLTVTGQKSRLLTVTDPKSNADKNHLSSPFACSFLFLLGSDGSCRGSSV